MDECGYFMVFAATTDKVIVESASDSEDSSNDEVHKKMTIQEAYDKLCTEFIKFEKTSHCCRKELNEVKTEKNWSINQIRWDYKVGWDSYCGEHLIRREDQESWGWA